jgi:DNA polymerase III delta prime subunit
MNYWHTQLHPDDRDTFNETRIRELLEQRAVIGLGQWDDGEAVRTQFFDEMRVGDIVAVKNGSTPIALVRVASEAYVENNVNEELDWFPNRRNIEVLDYYQYAYNFTFPDSRGTLKICRDLNAPTSRLIIDWYRTAQRNLLMENIKLSEKRKEEIKSLWKQFKDEYTETDCNDIQKAINELQTQWTTYREKIMDGSLSIDDYTNRKYSNDATMPGGYLCNFLERTTRVIYGSSKPGNANNFMVKLNEDGTTYTIKKELGRSEKQTTHSKDEATEIFNESIKPLLHAIVSSSDAEKIIQAIENSDYHAKQVLRKAAVLNNHSMFLSMYSDEAINSLHNEFVVSDEASNIGKGHEVRVIANHLLDIDTESQVESVLLSRFLWKYATISGIEDQDSPNVILYGPPGTGKTYAVRNSLKYLCQGDKSRYEIVQFHPSFTYEDFIEGIKPKGVTKDGNIKFEFVDGVFKKFCKIAKEECEKAKAEKREPNAYYFIVDEINRANLSSVFGETLSLLEKGYRHNGVDGTNLMKTQYSGLIEDLIKDDPESKSLAYHLEDSQVYFGVPENVYFIGMMNDVDKSIDTFDLALRRRFKWIRKDCDYDVIENDVKFRNGDDFNNIEEYRKCCEKLNTFISQELGLGKSYEFGHSFFMKITSIANSKNITAKNLETLFKLHLQPTFKEYLRAMYPESELDKKIAEALQKFTSKIQAK